MEHTPTPWAVRPDLNDRALKIEGGNGTIIATSLKSWPCDVEDARFLVTACNAHDDLVALTKKDLSTMEIAKERLSDMGKSTLELDFAINESRAALASVER